MVQFAESPGVIIEYAKVEATKENTKATTGSIEGEDRGRRWRVEEGGKEKGGYYYECKLTQWFQFVVRK